MILPPGSFTVSVRRKPIPVWVKIVCAIHALQKSFENLLNDKPSSWPAYSDSELIKWVRSLRYDHRPALQDRPYDTEAGDFIPPQNDPAHIEAIPSTDHDQRTFGRKADAERTATTAGSDAHRRAHDRHLHDSELIHQAKIAAKRGDDKAAVAFLSQVRQRTRLRRKRKIANRGFQKQPPAVRHTAAK